MTRRDEIETAAASWILRQEDGALSSGELDELQDWLDESVAHQAAYWRLDHGWQRVSQALDEAPGPPTPLRRLIAAASGRPLRATLLAASVMLAIGIGVIWSGRHMGQPVQMATYSMGPRQTGTLRLADGSQIELNTEASIRIPQSGENREVWLDRGEAFFSVAKDPAHPFIVHSGARTVTVLGTKFSVQRNAGRMTVSVVEGRVRLADPVEPDRLTGVVIGRGDIAMVNGASTLIKSGSQDRIERSLSWRSGRLVFDNTPLSEAVRQFNRYNETQLVIDDPRLADIRIGGTFRSGRTDSFAALLEDAFDIEAIRRDDTIILRSK